MLHPKKVGTLPVAGNTEELKQTNEIGMAIPLLDAIDIQGKDISADALLTQRKFARYLVQQRQAHYHFTVKTNQPTLYEDIALHFQDRQAPEFVQVDPPEHGRIETRKIWTTSALNGYLAFPHLGQAFLVQRDTIDKKTGKHSSDFAYCITSRTRDEAGPERLLQTVMRSST